MRLVSAVLEFGMPMGWLHSHTPTMELAQFQPRWCHRKVLCRAESDRIHSCAGRQRPPAPLHRGFEQRVAAGALPAAGAKAAAAAGRRTWDRLVSAYRLLGLVCLAHRLSHVGSVA